MTVALHWNARPRAGFRLLSPESARWLWQHLHRAFPNAYACCLMPDHVHLLVPAGSDEQKWRRILTQHGRVFGTSWLTYSEDASTTKITWRTIAYVACNPVRSHLIEDPWEWPWSTLRDLAGAIAEPWTVEPVRRISQTLGVPRGQVLSRITRFDGQHAPLPDRRPLVPPISSLSSVLAAVASTLRALPDGIQRRGPARTLFVHLASACGPVSKKLLAETCHVTPRAIRKILDQPQPSGFVCALRCLADPRLAIHDVDTAGKPETQRRPPALVLP